jgi:predicted site-specific integrase-resolvase
MKYKISQYAKKHNVTYRTVWNWVKENKVNFEQDHSVTIRIIENLEKDFKVAIYARVSSSENKDNLERQKQRLLDYCAAKGYKVSSVVIEIGSGLNDTRPKLEHLLLDSSINLIVVEHKDRLARFGLNYIEKLLSMQNRKIEVLNPQPNEIDDLMQDFVSIITSFTARLYGKRRSKRATEKLIKNLEND